MRPKIVVLTLVVAVALVALAALLKGTVGRNSDGDAKPTPTDAGTESTAAAAPARAGSSNNATNSEQLRAAEIEKQLEEIRGLVVEGTGDPSVRGLLLDKVTHAEPAVRSAALQAVVAINDTNAIPRLEEAEQIVENPREKVAILDAIAYLKLPETLPDVPPTNDLPGMDFSQPPVKKSSAANPQAKGAAKTRASRRLQRAQPQGQPGAPQAQAPAPAPATPATPPQ
jgi:hypothetical protein